MSILSVHEKKKPFHSIVCDNRYFLKAILTQHVTSVHEKNYIFKCEISCFQKILWPSISVHEKENPKNLKLEATVVLYNSCSVKGSL